MDDRLLVRFVAADYVHRIGMNAPQYLSECEQAARCDGDALSAQAWGDIAHLARVILAELLREKAAQCRRLAEGMPANEPIVHTLWSLADEFESRAARHMN